MRLESDTPQYFHKKMADKKHKMDIKSTSEQEEKTEAITPPDTAWLKELGIQSWKTELVIHSKTQKFITVRMFTKI